MPTYVITGASRGIGLGIFKALAKTESNTIIAAVRNPAAATVEEVKNSAKATVHSVALEQDKEESIRNFAAETKKLVGKVDYLLNVAAMSKSSSETPANVSQSLLLEHITVNVWGPALITELLHSNFLLQPGSFVLNWSSGLGSVALTVANHASNNLSYSISKAALNLLTAKQAKEWPDITFLSVDPGWVKTDMGGKEAHLEVETSVNGLIDNVIHAKGLEDSGGSFAYTGERIPY